jgi:hypothetical protein
MELKKVGMKKKRLWWIKYMLLLLTCALILLALFKNMFWAAGHGGVKLSSPVSRRRIKAHVSQNTAFFFLSFLPYSL